MMGRNRSARRRAKAFHRQKGKCYYCGIKMLLIAGPADGTKPDSRMCTLKHLDDRYSPQRGMHPGEWRVAAACWQCNNDQNAAREAQLPREILWAKSGQLEKCRGDA